MASHSSRRDSFGRTNPHESSRETPCSPTASDFPTLRRDRGFKGAAKTELRASTEEAVSRGAFGAPTFSLHTTGGEGVDDEMFFGASPVFFLERALADS